MLAVVSVLWVWLWVVPMAPSVVCGGRQLVCFRCMILPVMTLGKPFAAASRRLVAEPLLAIMPLRKVSAAVSGCVGQLPVKSVPVLLH